MDFKKFIANAKDPAKIKKALEGFHERQRERERTFEQQAKSREPSAQWYLRQYGTCDATSSVDHA